MSAKTIIATIITALLTIVLIQNTDTVKFTILLSDVYISKLVVMTAVSVAAFILGVMAGRPKRVKQEDLHYHDNDYPDEKPDTLSDEDREYINYR